ncbi:alpha/beta-hydrolase [Paraphaeosphaeria sporulosa]|uniref:Alpha/beta-hydrolase n=1 Tax=Paraphaeosphaeria sporulosa TaxID=1460663 RepID=A0A177C719_9PLEO|nr:alpha/beta-hydrolase [Paraphaeosphaeria sporulosa]OAG03335.1 alpha/beta-hydrolase [Paraphaeosphaeria sporulosa]
MPQAAHSPARNPLPPLPLPDGVTEHYLQCPSNGLTFHLLEAGYSPEKQKPLVILVHGYPELAFSWRKVLPALANAGYYVVAFDQRGYGRTTGWDNSPFPKVNMAEFTVTNLVRDVVVLVHALGYRAVKCIVGHDFGAVTSSMCAWMRPDLFHSVVMMSHPFKEHPGLPFDLLHGEPSTPPPQVDIQKELAKLPEPRKHYKWYNATSTAALHWYSPNQGLAAFLRGYWHVKSADWDGNDPQPLEAWSAPELAKMPFYYIMPFAKSMPETIELMMRGEDAEKSKRWLSDEALEVYVQEWRRTGFQGGLNWYRTMADPENKRDMDLFAGRKIECPSIFISGAKDWGNYQEPGALQGFPKTCSQFKGVRIIEGAGHWPQQEQPEAVVKEILGFLENL